MIAAVTQNNVLVDMLIFFGWVIWFWLLIVVFGDLFRDHELSGGVKVLWIIFVIVLPYLGVFVYLIARGHGMQARQLAQQQAAKASFGAYVQETVGTSTADELSKLAELHNKGLLTDEEFAAQKAKVLA